MNHHENRWEMRNFKNLKLVFKIFTLVNIDPSKQTVCKPANE